MPPFSPFFPTNWFSDHSEFHHLE